MKEEDVIKIFDMQNENDYIDGNGKTSIDNFLNVAGFAECEPTKQAMLEFDAGKKGYKELIENGNFEVQQ